VATILIIDDDTLMGGLLSRWAEDAGHKPIAVETIRQGQDILKKAPVDVVFLDVYLPDGNGLEVLPGIRDAAYSPEVIIITGAGDPNGAELAVRSGAWDYVQKPIRQNEFLLQMGRTLQYRAEKRQRKGPVVLDRSGIVGSGNELTACLERVAQAAGNSANVLITGETGTGKELFARAVHTNSARSSHLFVVVDCAALPDNLVESELFGHEKGAFTGADSSRPGLIAQARGGTLFLDEIGELPASAQKAFLRVLQEHRIRPIGSKRELDCDFRLISATNRDLEAMVEEGGFRKDLLFRLRAFHIDLPPLRGRSEDIREIAMHCVRTLCERHDIDTKGFSPEFFHALTSYTWPGNVRELIHGLELAVFAEPLDPILYPKHLPQHIRIHLARKAFRSSSPKEGSPAESPLGDGDVFPAYASYRKTGLAGIERRYLQELFSRTGGSMQAACRVSGLSRTRLYELMKRHGITRHGSSAIRPAS